MILKVTKLGKLKLWRQIKKWEQLSLGNSLWIWTSLFWWTYFCVLRNNCRSVNNLWLIRLWEGSMKGKGRRNINLAKQNAAQRFLKLWNRRDPFEKVDYRIYRSMYDFPHMKLHEVPRNILNFPLVIFCQDIVTILFQILYSADHFNKSSIS